MRIYSDSHRRAPLTQWLESLEDIQARARIRARLARLAAGNFGDCKALREGVQELRIDHGPGYRVYPESTRAGGRASAVRQRQGRSKSRHQTGHRVFERLEAARQAMNAPRDISYEETLLPLLKDPAEAAAYIEAVMELNDPAALLVALRQVTKAHGMAEVARRAQVSDKMLFKALSAGGNPTLATVHKVLHAVGLRLSVTPEHAS